MAIEKALSQAPLGLTAEMMDEAAMAEPAIEIEIEDPERVEIGMGGLEIILEPGREQNDDFNANIAEELDEDILVHLPTTCLVILRTTSPPEKTGCRHTSTVLTCWV